jgi:integrase/recombinase XerD
VLRILLIWLRVASNLQSNALALMRSPRKPQAVRVELYLSDPHWQAVVTSIAAMRPQTDEQISVVARARWSCVLPCGTGMRIAELAGATVGSISPVLGSDGHTHWRLKVVGKGGKQREIPSSIDLVKEFAKYRKAIGLPEQVNEGDMSPLIHPPRGAFRPLSRRALHTALKQTFEAAVAAVRARGTTIEDAARHVDAASAHWLRHSAGSVWANNIGIKAAQPNLGHSQLNITGVYLHDTRSGQSVSAVLILCC